MRVNCVSRMNAHYNVIPCAVGLLVEYSVKIQKITVSYAYPTLDYTLLMSTVRSESM